MLARALVLCGGQHAGTSSSGSGSSTSSSSASSAGASSSSASSRQPQRQQQPQHPRLLQLLAPAWQAGGLHELRSQLQLRQPVIASPAEARSSSGSGGASSSSSSPQAGSDGAAKRSAGQILRSAGARAIGGGLPGAAAMVVQVLALMWLRTTVNYQYRTGSSTSAALRALYRDGGVPRFYQGVGPALLQGPLCRFGDTAANAGVLSLLGEWEVTDRLPVGAKTAAASAAAGCWRMMLLPLDAAKTMMQVEGRHGLRHLFVKVRSHGPGVLYHGAAAALAASFVGHFPWFTTYNTLNQLLPVPESLHGKLLRSAGIGFCAGVASDVVSNSVRVVKTSRQTARRSTSYRDVVRSIVAQDGLTGLFTRGLKTRIAANGLQNICFTVLWQLGQERLKHSGFMSRIEGRASGAGDGGGDTAAGEQRSGRAAA